MIRCVELGDLIAPAKVRRAGHEDLPILSMTMRGGLVDQADKFKKRIASTDTSPYKRVLRDQLVVGFPIDEGVLSFQTLYDEAIVSPAYDVWDIRQPMHVVPSFLARVLRSPRALAFYRSKLQSTTARRRTIPDDLFLSLPIALPDVSVQVKVTTVLDKVDSFRRKRQEAIRLADEFLRALFIDMFGDPETNPKSFAKGTIRDLVSSANYGTSEKASEQMGQYPILRMNNITYDGGWDFSSMKYVDLDEASAHKYLTQKGDLLFNRTNSKELVGKTAVYMRDEPIAIAGYLVRVRMNERGNAHYVSGYLNSAHGKRTLEARAKSIVGMANINAQEMQDIPLLLPPIELQDKFASIVGAMQERLRKHHAFSREAEALYAALSEKFFSQTGERVRELC
jgi:type I restriction enzyme S subunit